MEVPDQQVTKRIMIGVPMTGLVRAEWMLARYTQTIPCNWSQLDAIQWISTNAPLRYLVADARNILATSFVEKEYEWCFKGTTEIETTTGAKYIKDIKDGELVKTHKGHYKKVTKTFKRYYKQRQPLIWLRTSNNIIRCTPEHPFLVYRDNKTVWIEAKTVKLGDFLLYPSVSKTDYLYFNCYANTLGVNNDAKKGSIKNGKYHGKYLVGQDLARFLGLYLAEGSVERDGIRFTFNNNEKEYITFIQKFCKEKFNRKVTIYSRWATGVKLNIRSFAVRFEKWFGGYAYDKKVPEFVFNWNLKNKLSFIKGYIEGDGSESGGGRSFCSASDTLINDFIRLSHSCGLSCNGYGYVPATEATLKNGHTIKGKGSFHGRISTSSWNKLLDLLEAKQWNTYLLIPVVKIENKLMARGTGTDCNIYNLEVEDDNSYIANGASVHNCWFIDHDVILPNGTLMQWDERMLKCEVPVWSGLYFCKAVPATPLIYRGRGNSYFDKWKMGDLVWADGIPMGCTMIHKSIMKVLYDESEWYQVKSDVKAKRIFETPRDTWYSTSENAWHNSGGTEDLCWCTRVMKDNIFKKAGWPKYQKKKYPFLVDTKIFCRHINFDGQQFPGEGEELQFVRK